MDTSKRRKPVPHHRRPASEKQPAKYTVFRECIAIAVVGALLAVLFVDSVVGMSDDLASGPMVPVQVAMEVQDGR